jgi:hypothetical protein
VPTQKQPNPTEQALNSLVIGQLRSHRDGLTQTQLINKFRSSAAYGPRFTFHPNAIKKAVARLAAEGRLTVAPVGNDFHVSLVLGVENLGEEAGDA